MTARRTRGRGSVRHLEAELAAITALVDEKSEKKFLWLVDELAKHRTAAGLGALLAQIRDEEHDMMEHIMQTTDHFPEKLFSTVFSRELVPMHARAPYRTSIFVSRILQSRRALQAFVAALEGAGPEIQHALAKMFASIVEGRPDLRPRMDRVLRTIGERRRR